MWHERLVALFGSRIFFYVHYWYANYVAMHAFEKTTICLVNGTCGSRLPSDIVCYIKQLGLIYYTSGFDLVYYIKPFFSN